MKVIFLDFDGVITTLESRFNLSKVKMEMVKDIVDATGAKIVISSCWRYNTLEDTIKSITTVSNRVPEPFLMASDVIGVTKRLYPARGETRVLRGSEINLYLEEHPDITNYVILDDDTDMLPEQFSHFIHTDTYLGISEEDVLKAIEILNSSE